MYEVVCIVVVVFDFVVGVVEDVVVEVGVGVCVWFDDEDLVVVDVEVLVVEVVYLFGC